MRTAGNALAGFGVLLLMMWLIGVGAGVTFNNFIYLLVPVGVILLILGGAFRLVSRA